MLLPSLFAVFLVIGPATDDPSAEPEPETSDVLDGPVDVTSEPTPSPSEPMPPPAEPTPPPSAPPPTVVSPSPPVATPTTETKKKVDYEIEGEPGKGLTVKVGKVFSLNVKSRIQIRYQLNIPPEDADGNRSTRQVVNIGTARLWFSGHIITPKLKYMIQLAVAGRDYRDGATSPLYDAFLDWSIHRDFGVKAGQYFVPFDRLRTVRESALQMADRPRPVGELTLDRDVGVTLYSDHFLHDKSPVAYRIGAFGGGGMNLAAAKSPGGLFVGRLEVRPLGEIDDDEEGDLKRRKRPALALGGAFAANLETNRQKSTTGITFQGGTTNYYHAATDLVFKWRGWAVQGEYLRRWASVYSLVSTDPDGMTVTEYTRSGQGWIAQTSYVFDPPIEIVARLSGMYALGPTDPAFEADLQNRGQEVAGGLNYYFNGHRMKLQADWIGLMPRGFDFRRAEHIVHLQLDVTF